MLRKLCSVSALAVALAAGLATPAPAAEPRNVLLILTDDQAYDTLGLTNPQVKTPHLDRLFTDGTWFDRAAVSTSACPPSRLSVLSGLYFPAHRFTFEEPKPELSLLRMSYPALLRERGYHSGFAGKNGMHLDRPRARVLFDEWEFFRRDFVTAGGEHLTERITRSATRFIRAQSDERPWSLVVWFHAPHADSLNSEEPFVPPPKHRGLYRNVEFERPPGYQKWPTRPGFFRRGANRTRGKRWWDEESFQRNSRRYHALVRGVDDAVGELRAAISETGQGEETLIVFLSDNGFYRGERGFGGKWLAHQPSIRVPMAILDPADPGGRTISELVTNVDVAPTVLERLGVEVPEWMQGESLAPFLAGASVQGWRDHLFLEHSWTPSEGLTIPRTRGVLTATHKYLEYPGRRYRELYDLVADPDEMTNLAGRDSESAVEADLRSITRAREAELAAEVFADGFESESGRRWPQKRGLSRGTTIVEAGERAHPWVLAAALSGKKRVFAGLTLPERSAVSASFRVRAKGARSRTPVTVALFEPAGGGTGEPVRLTFETVSGAKRLVLTGKDGASAGLRVRNQWVSVAVLWEEASNELSLWKNGRRLGSVPGDGPRRLRFGLPEGGGSGTGNVLLDEFLIVTR